LTLGAFSPLRGGIMKVRVKIIKANPEYPIGQTITLKRRVALRLIKQGVAMISKDMIINDMELR